MKLADLDDYFIDDDHVWHQAAGEPERKVDLLVEGWTLSDALRSALGDNRAVRAGTASPCQCYLCEAANL